MELSFKFNEKANWKSGKFIIDELEIINEEIEYDDIKLYLDDKEYDGGISTFTTNDVSADWLFESVLNGYLRGDSSYHSFSEEWKVFKDIENKKEYQDDLIIKLPKYNYDRVELYELKLATRKYLYYEYSESCLLLSTDFVVITDMECFYMDSLYETIAEILLEKEKALYISDSMRRFIKENEEDILDEYRD